MSSTQGCLSFDYVPLICKNSCFETFLQVIWNSNLQSFAVVLFSNNSQKTLCVTFSLLTCTTFDTIFDYLSWQYWGGKMETTCCIIFYGLVLACLGMM